MLSILLGTLMVLQAPDMADTLGYLVKITGIHFRVQIVSKIGQIWLLQILRNWFFEILGVICPTPNWVWVFNIKFLMWGIGWKLETAISGGL